MIDVGDNRYPKILVKIVQNGVFSVEKGLSRYFSNLYGPFETEQNGSNLVRFKRAKPNGEISVWSRRRFQIERNPLSGASPNGASVSGLDLGSLAFASTLQWLFQI